MPTACKGTHAALAHPYRCLAAEGEALVCIHWAQNDEFFLVGGYWLSLQVVKGLLCIGRSIGGSIGDEIV